MADIRSVARGICYSLGVSVEARSRHSFRNNTPSHVSQPLRRLITSHLGTSSKKRIYTIIFPASLFRVLNLELYNWLIIQVLKIKKECR